MNTGEQLTAGYKKASVLEKDLRGTRHWIKASLLKKEATPGDIYSVSIPQLFDISGTQLNGTANY